MLNMLFSITARENSVVFGRVNTHKSALGYMELGYGAEIKPLLCRHMPIRIPLSNGLLTDVSSSYLIYDNWTVNHSIRCGEPLHLSTYTAHRKLLEQDQMKLVYTFHLTWINGAVWNHSINGINKHLGRHCKPVTCINKTGNMQN